MFYIDLVGLSSDCIGDVTIDSIVALNQIHPTYSVVLIPLTKTPLSLEYVTFISNCLAYEHEIPVSLYQGHTPLFKPIFRSYSDQNNLLNHAYEVIFDIKYGYGVILFRYPAFFTSKNINYSGRYSTVSKEISLYSSALRQLDPFSEYLHYYRIIESATNSNGKAWISKNISRITEYKFGFLGYRKANDFTSEKCINVFSVYKKKAIARLAKLSLKIPDGEIERYLYNENRCGIAHGRDQVKLFDYGVDFSDIVEDVFIMKLLSRIVIEDKMRSTAL